MVDNWKISKMTEAIFTGKLIFAQIWAKSAQYGPKMRFLGFLKNFVISFPGNNQNKNLYWY